MANDTRTYNPKTQVVVVWDIADVQALAPELSDEEAMQVLETAVRLHDASVGINWTVLDCYIRELFPEVEVQSV